MLSTGLPGVLQYIQRNLTLVLSFSSISKDISFFHSSESSTGSTTEINELILSTSTRHNSGVSMVDFEQLNAGYGN